MLATAAQKPRLQFAQPRVAMAAQEAERPAVVVSEAHPQVTAVAAARTAAGRRTWPEKRGERSLAVQRAIVSVATTKAMISMTRFRVSAVGMVKASTRRPRPGR